MLWWGWCSDLFLDEQFRVDGFDVMVGSHVVDVAVEQLSPGFRSGEIGRCGRQWRTAVASAKTITKNDKPTR